MSEQKQCPECHGTGYVVRGQYEPRIEDCDFCGAKGRVYIDYDATDKQHRLPKPRLR